MAFGPTMPLGLLAGAAYNSQTLQDCLCLTGNNWIFFFFPESRPAVCKHLDDTHLSYLPHLWWIFLSLLSFYPQGRTGDDGCVWQQIQGRISWRKVAPKTVGCNQYCQCGLYYLVFALDSTRMCGQAMKDVFDKEYKAKFLKAGLLERSGNELQVLGMLWHCTISETAAYIWYIYMCIRRLDRLSVLETNSRYGVATISRLLKIISLFCRISSLL